MSDYCQFCGQKLPGKLRSTGPLSQNHHYNSHCAQIARETGNDFSDVKVGVKARAVKRGFPEPHVIQIKGRGPVEVWKSEADCTTLECSWLIDEVHAVADDLGIVLKEE